MTLTVLVAASALLTYLSRAAATAFLPPPTGALARFVERIPAPLFAGLAVFALIGEEASLPSIPTVAAAVAALAVSPLRSLPMALGAGLTAYGLATWLT